MHEAEDGPIEWPYPADYGKENEVSGDILVLGGGVAGCAAAITAARKGLKVILVDKSSIIRSGATGTGFDHWGNCPGNPASKVTPEELVQTEIEAAGGWSFGIPSYITCRESYDWLLELENLGMKIRDSEDEFKGAEFRDEKTKLLFANDYENRYTVRVWGTGLKPAFYNECRRLGVKMYPRIMVTSLLTEDGKQGSRVVGATGVSVRDGEFHIFKGKATVLCMSRPERVWIFSAELTGLYSFHPNYCVGDGHAMAWEAGAEFAMMEKSGKSGGGFTYPPYGIGNPRNTWYPCNMVDANGKEIPWLDRDGKVLPTVSERCHPAPGQKLFFSGAGPGSATRPTLKYEYMGPHLPFDLAERIANGEYVLPLYADLPSMPEHERRVIFGLMVGQEGKTRIPVYYNLTRAGFDPDKDLLQYYEGGWYGLGPPQWRTTRPSIGGPVVDWDLRTSLEGLYAAGQQLPLGVGVSHACCTGGYAARKAVEYALTARGPVISREQVEAEKTRVYAPLKRKDGMEWKELNAGVCRVMQDYCGETKNEELLKLGLRWLNEIKEQEATTLYARNPHDLWRGLEVLTLINVGEMIIYACLARQASSRWLGFKRTDYPEMDPPEWYKLVTTRLEEGKVRIGELPIDYWSPLRENYEVHCGL